MFVHICSKRKRCYGKRMERAPPTVHPSSLYLWRPGLRLKDALFMDGAPVPSLLFFVTPPLLSPSSRLSNFCHSEVTSTSTIQFYKLAFKKFSSHLIACSSVPRPFFPSLARAFLHRVSSHTLPLVTSFFLSAECSQVQSIEQPSPSPRLILSSSTLFRPFHPPSLPLECPSSSPSRPKKGTLASPRPSSLKEPT